MRAWRLRTLMALVAGIALACGAAVELTNRRRRDAAAFLESLYEKQAADHDREAATCRDAIRRGLPPDPTRRLPTINGGSIGAGPWEFEVRHHEQGAEIYRLEARRAGRERQFYQDRLLIPF